MRERRLDDRGVSTTIGYALTLGVASLLITGLLIAGGGFLEDQRERTTTTELEVIGEQIAADLSSADRLSGSGVDSVTITRNLPDRVTGSAYTVNVTNSPQSHLVLKSAEPRLTVRVDFAVNEVDKVVETDIDGGDIEVTYDPSANELILTNANS